MNDLKIYTVGFNPMYPVPSGLLILAKNEEEAWEIAFNTIKHDRPLNIQLIPMDESKVIFYESGDY